MTGAPQMIHKHPDGAEEWMAFFKDDEGRERKALLARGLRRRHIHRRMARIRLQVKGQGLF